MKKELASLKKSLRGYKTLPLLSQRNFKVEIAALKAKIEYIENLINN